MSVGDLSASAENYLKIIWGLQEWSPDPVVPSMIADRAAVGMSTVSEAVRKLAARGLVKHAPYGAVSLTDAGHRVAVAVVRRHRLIETFLHEVLGYSWDEIHDEADVLEHAVSDLFVDRVDRMLGSPTRDPHGDPIPDVMGVTSLPDAVALSEVGGSGRVRVERVSDVDPATLRFCADNGVTIGAVFDLTVLRDLTVSHGHADHVLTRVEDVSVSVSVPSQIADAVFVSVPDSGGVG